MANKRGSGSYDYIEAQDRWRWRGYYIDPVTGKRKIKSIYSKSKKDLREKVEEWLLIQYVVWRWAILTRF